MPISSIGIIGAGKVGSAFARAFHSIGIPVTHIVNRSLKKAKYLSESISGSKASDSLPIHADQWPDLWLICVNDDNISLVVDAIAKINPSATAYHTSGSFNTQNMHNVLPTLGALYPLQSFSEDKEVDFSMVPLCLFSPDNQQLERIKDLSLKLSKHTIVIEDEDRKYLHLSAVFVNNFTNALVHCSQQILKARSLPPELLSPLLAETVEKLKIMPPDKAQTGPAIRHDHTTLDEHRALLEDFPDSYNHLYNLITDYIQNYINPNYKE